MTENQRQERAGLRTVNRAVPKKDSMQLLLGKKGLHAAFAGQAGLYR